MRRSTQAASPEGQRLTRESSTAPATAAMPSPITRQRMVPTLAERRRGDRVLLALVRDDQRGGEVDQDPGAADQREDDEPDSVERGVDAEVAREAPADAREHAVGTAALEALDGRLLGTVFAHTGRVAERRCSGNPE